MADWTSHARDALRQGPAALVTILATEGSAPRGPGARMVVTGAGLAGTIGGGALEHQAMAQARAILALAPGSWRVQDYPLGPLLGQCCGGRVRLLVERLDDVPESDGPFAVTLARHASSAWPGQDGERLDCPRAARSPLPAPASSSPPRPTCCRSLCSAPAMSAAPSPRARPACRSTSPGMTAARRRPKPPASSSPDEDAMVACAGQARRGRGGGDPHPRSRARLPPDRRRARQPRALRRADRLARPSAPASSRASRPTASTRRA